MPTTANTLEPTGDALVPNRLSRVLAEDITSATRLDLLLLPLMSELARELDAPTAILYLVDRERRELVAIAQHLPGLPEVRCPIGQGLVGEVAAQGESARAGLDDRRLAVPVLTRDVLGEPEKVIAVIETHRASDAAHFDDTSLRTLQQASRDVCEILRVTQLDDSASSPTRYNNIVGQSPAMQELYGEIHRASLRLQPTLLFGPAGSGKTLVARAIHASSRERRQRWLRIQPSRLPPALVEDILFDRDGGAIAAASGTTLFIEHITALSPVCQERLAESLRSGELGTGRLLASTRRPLAFEVAAGRFDPALAKELHADAICLPSLQALGFEDFTRLVLFWLRQAAKASGRAARQIDGDALRYLHDRQWSVAQRELRQWVEASVLRTQEPVLGIADVNRETASKGPSGELSLPLGLSLAQVEERYIQRALVQHKQNRTRTATALGIGRNTLVRKIKDYRK